MKQTLYLKNRPAFTLLEMVFVITILGIVAGIASEVIAKTYDSYITQRALARSSMKTEIAAAQIANRLSYAIPGSIVARNNAELIGIGNIGNLGLALNRFNALEWIGYDRDGYTTRNAPEDGTAAPRLPGWSGFADLGATGRPAAGANPVNLSTPGSNLPLANAIIATLSASGNARALAGSVVYFPTDISLFTEGNPGNYNLSSIPASNGIYTILAQVNPNTLSINIPVIPLPNPALEVKEQYKLAWTSYALVLTANPRHAGTFNLTLHYNFQPWNGETYNGGVQQQSLLLTNVSVFRFTGSGNSVRFKICQREYIGSRPTDFISICKEKAVIR